MPDVTDIALAREFAASNSEPAFAELVRRHINLVYSVALRYVGNAQDAQDVTQAVFIILAQKAAKLRGYTVLTGWMYETTRFTALRFLRTNTRRQFREQEAYMQSTSDESDTDNVWRQLAPLLEEAMTRLNEKERTLLALRFFENRTGAEAAALLGIEEWAGRKRANRALEKLRKFFTKRGITFSAAAIAGAVSANSVHAAPVGLVKTISVVAIAKGAAAGGSTLALVKGALKIMAWSKAKTAIVIGVGILLAAGTTSVTVRAVHQHQNAEWDIGRLDGSILRTAPHIVRIIPSRFPDQGGWTSIANGRILGFGNSVGNLVQAAYGGGAHFDSPPARTIFLTKLPLEKYDFIANLPSGSEAAFRQKIERQFGIVAQRETLETNVLFLRVEFSNATGIRPTVAPNYQGPNGGGYGDYHYTNAPMAYIAKLAEDFLGVPVVDRTGLTGHYDISLKFDYQNDPQHENLKKAFTEQLGLKLVPGTAPVEMLVVEKAQN